MSSRVVLPPLFAEGDPIRGLYLTDSFGWGFEQNIGTQGFEYNAADQGLEQNVGDKDFE